jgi:CheY-like chemotaxis protein
MLTILCIDDDREALLLREAVFRAEGFQVLTAPTGRQGIALANEQSCDVVVLDYSLPDMNGDEVARTLISAFPNLPIILCSGYDDLPEAVFKIVDAFVAKGDVPEFLVMTIKSVIGRKKAPQPERRLQRNMRKDG